MNPNRARIAALLVVPALLVPLAACSSSKPNGSATSPTASPTATSSLKTTSLTAKEVTVSGPAGQAPTVTFPTPSQAQTLSTNDVTPGTGAAAKETDMITVNYVGIGALSGKQFDSSWGKAPLTFALAQVIAGWKQGIPGMKIGGQRTLVIPGALAYAENPPGPEIQLNETLVFVVTLVSIGAKQG